MSTLQWLSIGVFISIATSSILFVAISRPLSSFIRSLCPDGESERFWLRFTMVMLFLVPLFFALTVYLPNPDIVNVGGYPASTGWVVQRMMRATVLGAFGSMICTGLWISSLARRALRTKTGDQSL